MLRGLFSFGRGAVIGGLIGGIVGLLMAPHSGRETQERLQQRWEAAFEEGRRAAEVRRHELEAEYARARRRPPLS